MSNQRTRRIDRVTAEQLLRGVPVDASDGVRGGGVGRLAGVLAAAAAPVRVGELAGEEAAVAAFREARLGPAVESRRQSMIQSALAKLLTVKVAALTIGFTALGGVALAAGTGTLPTPLDKGPSAHPTSSPSAGSEGAGGPESPRPSPSLKGKGADSKGTPSPSMVGLCRAYAAKPVGARGKALESPAFTALVTAAGGKQNVAAFCKVVLAAKASGAPESPAAVRPTEKPKSSGAPVEPGGKASRPAPSVTPTARVSG